MNEDELPYSVKCDGCGRSMVNGFLEGWIVAENNNNSSNSFTILNFGDKHNGTGKIFCDRICMNKYYDSKYLTRKFY